MWRLSLLTLAALPFLLTAQAQNSGVKGDWREPGGSVIRIASCGPDVCATLIGISRQAPSRVDGRNPEPKERSRNLCGLQIGTGFQPNGPDHAGNGHLYDPKSGRTYHGEMTSEGDTLHLRGYVGFRLFGRTEDWTRVVGGLKGSCS